MTVMMDLLDLKAKEYFSNMELHEAETKRRATTQMKVLFISSFLVIFRI